MGAITCEQPSLFSEALTEDPDFLTQQLITYIGNKRQLLPFIATGLREAKERLGKDKISFLDLFSGSGVVSRMARQHSNILHCNDLELYSEVTNLCYQTDRDVLERSDLQAELLRLNAAIRSDARPGFITEMYSPSDESDIQPGERVFYTRRNAIFLDSFCHALRSTPAELKQYVLAPILSQASKHTNTSGVFKGFYKNKDGVGQFGGQSENALIRIKRDIRLEEPILSRVSCASFVHRSDANELVRTIEPVDIAYLDPPYNQHPYGSNYFMLNLLCRYEEPAYYSSVSGIPSDWNRSLYNKPKHASETLFDAIDHLKARFVLISYSSDGFIQRETFMAELARLGEVSVMDTRYNTFRGCRNLADRSVYVTENLYLLEKR